MQNLKSSANEASGKFGEWMRTHVNFFYRGMAVFTILGMLFLLFSRVILGDDSPIQDGGVGSKTQQQVGSGTVTILQREINPKTGYGEVLFSVDQPTDNVDTKFEAIAGDYNEQKDLPTKLEKVTDQYYVLHLYHVRSNWHQIAINYGLVTKSSPLVDFDYTQLAESDQVSPPKNSKDVSQQTYMMDYRRVKQGTNLAQKSHKTYVKKYVELEISDTRQAIKTVQDGQSQARELIKKYNAHIDTLKSQEGTATPYDLNKIKNSIQDTQRKIVGLKKTITSGTKAIKTYRSVLNKLYEQRKEY